MTFQLKFWQIFFSVKVTNFSTNYKEIQRTLNSQNKLEKEKLGGLGRRISTAYTPDPVCLCVCGVLGRGLMIVSLYPELGSCECI